MLPGLEYDAHLKANLTQPALVVPLLTRVVGTAATNIVTLPSSSVLSNFDTLVMEARLSCEGAFDADCDAWDHVITVAAQCQPATCDPTHHNLCEPDIGPHEMGRWITPYRRRVGHWLTDITPWLAVFQGSARCNISFVATDNGHPWVFDLALRFVASGSQSAALRPVQMIPLFNTTVLQTFDNTYNLRPTLTVQTPTAFSAKGAQLVALVTGHGDMEFEPSRHAFVVNNQQFNLSFMEPLNQWGCSDKVRTEKKVIGKK